MHTCGSLDMIVDGVSLLVVVVDMRGDLQMCVGPLIPARRLTSAKATRFLVKSCDRRPRITIVIVRRVFSIDGRLSHMTYGRASSAGIRFIRCCSPLFIILSSFMIPQHTLVDNRYLPRTTMS